MSSEPTLRDRIQHMLDAIESIERFTDGGLRARFDGDEMVRLSVVRQLEVVGEAAAAIPAGLRAEFPGAPWRRIVGMRNLLVHQYFGIDYDLVWESVELGLPGLKVVLLEMLAALPDIDAGPRSSP